MAIIHSRLGRCSGGGWNVPDKVLRLKGKGFPVFSIYIHSNLNVRLQVAHPGKLLAEERHSIPGCKMNKYSKKHW